MDFMVHREVEMNYQKKKRNKQDRCNICGKMSDLTWDHVPPKSCYNSGSIKYNQLFEGIPSDKYEGIFQSGIRFRSLCEYCNNNLLGANYDIEFLKFTSQVSQIIQSPIVLPQTLYFECNINKIARAVCGHLIAAKNEYLDAPMFNELRNFVCDEMALPPSNRKLLFRIYPHSTVVINQGFTIKNVLSREKLGNYPLGVCSIISCYPTAYVLCDDGGNSGLRDLFEFCTTNITDIVKFPIDIKSCFYSNTSIFRHFLWPCNIGDDNYSVDLMLGGNETILGIQKRGFHQ